jgi:dihydroorotase
VVKTMIETKLLTWTQLVERMSIRPAEIAGYSEHGQELSVGSVGNLIVVDPSATRTVDRNKMSSKSRNTPYHGMVLPAVVTHTLYKGKLVLSPEGVQH